MIQFHFEFQLLVDLVTFLSTFTKSDGTIENVCFGCNVDVNGVKYWSKYVRDCAPERVSEDELKSPLQNGYLFGFIQRFV